MPACRIALLFEFATLNGGERSMLAVIDWHQSNHSDVEFLAIAPEKGRLAESLRERSIRIVDWSVRGNDGIRRSAEQIETSLCNIVAGVAPHLLHANSLAMGRLAGRLCNRLEIPTTCHLRDIIKLSNTAITDLNRNVKLVAVSRATRDFHVAQGLCAQRVTVVENGIDADEFQPHASSGDLITELGLNEAIQNRLIATIGQIGLRKGQDVLAVAAPFIIQEIPDCHFLIIGERNSQKSESVEFERNISQRFATAGLADHLHFLGHRDDVAFLLNEIDVLVHPAHQEPFGRVLLEASAVGVPIVATDVGGTPEIVIDEQTGLLVPAGDARALADAVIRILKNPEARCRFGDAARNRMMREFGVSASARKIFDVWQQSLDQSGETQ